VQPSGTEKERARVPYLAWLPWILLVLAAADLIAVRAGYLSHSPDLVAWLMAAALIALVLSMTRHGYDLVRGRPDRGRSAGKLLLTAGIALALAGGMANWLLGLQGYAILTEGEKARLHGGTDLQGFEAGPMADLDEMGIVLQLDELELRPSGAANFLPVSRLRIWRGHGEPSAVSIDPGKDGNAGPLYFHQGAFGFAPRIVIVREGDPSETVFDRVVPFMTERQSSRGITFGGALTIAAENLRVDGAIDLASLDEAMRGHATLVMTVSREGEVLGQGSLLPGHFAELDGGYRAGFAGLQMWSEIVISRRNYRSAVLAGVVLSLIGLFAWVLARWRGR
jgi:hypothetical protein